MSRRPEDARRPKVSLDRGENGGGPYRREVSHVTEVLGAGRVGDHTGKW